MQTDEAGTRMVGLSGDDYHQFMSFLEETLFLELKAEGETLKIDVGE
jgi:hypothetical protein